MNLTVKFTIITFLILFAKLLFAQTNGNVVSVNRLICKEWRLVSFEEEDGKFEPSPDQIGDRMKFELNHKVEYVEISKYKTGIWKYDSRNKVLMVTNDQTKEQKVLKVVKINNAELVLQYKDSEGSLLKMYMAAVNRRQKGKYAKS